VRQIKLISGASIAVAIVSMLVLAGVSYASLDISGPLKVLLLAVFLAFFGTSEWVLWTALEPPVLRADSMEVSCSTRFDRQRMSRSDVAFIFRGQLKPRRQPRGPWARSYIFAAADGKVGISCSPLVFTADGMTQFAQRLQVPIRGDFSAQVRDRIDPAMT
jgi:hypothetical protein